MSVFARAMSLGAILIMLAAYTAPAKAQEQPQAVHGIIFDSEGNPLVGATVVVAGGVQGTTTDTKGKFTLKVKPSDSLTFSYLGYTSQTTKVGSRTKFNIRLEKDASTDIEEVVVIGYGQVAKKDLTGSVSTVKMNDIKDLPTLSVDNALQGRIAGADFMSTTGEPGATTTIRIRGTRSINASNEPLIVVDGVMDAIHDLNDINSDDIASISVLKDASSTAIYGSRGANGVILITTKRGLGTTGKPNITFKTDIGFSQLPRHLDIMNAAEFAQYRNDYASFGSDANHPDIGADTPLSGSVYPDPLSLGEGTDWIKEITRTAISSNYALSLSGTNEKASYYSSFSYNDTQGIIDDSGQKRFTGRINLERQLFKWLKVGYTGSYTWRHNDQNKATIGGTNWWSGAQYLSPLLKPTDTYNPLYYNGQKINTPRALIDQNTHYLERHSSNHNFSLKLEPIKNFTINSTFSYYLYQRHTYRYYPGTLPMKSENEGGEAYRADWDENSFSWETTAGYKFEKNGHALDVLGGFSAYRFVSHDFNLSGKGYMDDAIMWNNMNAVLDKETYSAGTAYSKKTKMSVYARLNYNWKSRYYLTVTGRYDGASNFAANNKWAFFPSAAVKWNLANENFLKDCDWIDDLSIRVSAGLTGNDAISTYRSLAVLSSTTGGYLFDGSQPVAFYRSRLDSPDLTWEKTAAYNVAIDWSMFKGRLNITAEAYKSKTTDLLMSLAVAAQTGYTSRWTNIGSTSNKGIELSIESQNIVRPNFHWTTTLTMSHNDQMVDDIGRLHFGLRLAGQQQLHDVRIRQGIPAQLAVGLQVRRHVEKRRRTQGERNYEDLRERLQHRRRRTLLRRQPRRRDVARRPDLSGQRRPLSVWRSAKHVLHSRLQTGCLFRLLARRQDLQLFGDLHGRFPVREPVPLHARRLASRAQPQLRHPARRSQERRRATERLHDSRRFVSATEKRHARLHVRFAEKMLVAARPHAERIGRKPLSVEEIQRIRSRRIERRHLVDAAPHGLGRLPQTPNHHIQHPVEILNQ